MARSSSVGHSFGVDRVELPNVLVFFNSLIYHLPYGFGLVTTSSSGSGTTSTTFDFHPKKLQPFFLVFVIDSSVFFVPADVTD